MPSKKTPIIEDLFNQRWNPVTRTLTNPIVTLADVQAAIHLYNTTHPTSQLSTANPANFFKDFTRSIASANQNWPASVLANGYTARQRTGNNECFEFVPLPVGQVTPFLQSAPWLNLPQHLIQSASMSLTSKRLGRRDETWLTQVLVRLHVIETHLAAYSPRNIVQVDHLQMGVKQTASEIDALYLAIEDLGNGNTQEAIICCEAKGRRDDILEDQIVAQVRTTFAMRGLTQNLVIPMAAKAVSRSKVYVAEYDAVVRGTAPITLTVLSQAMYEFVPPVAGIGE